jgi:tetratricopeptide (TPR) repeat protein
MTRARVPLDWATTQNNLGSALWSLGEREAGTARLEEAVEAFRDALKERTRERVPLDWAMTQTNLGLALSRLGERIGDRAKLVEARKAIEAAFDVYMQAGQEQYRGYFEDRLRAIDQQIAELTPPR